VYTLGPAFRADNAIDRTHLSEFYMMEAELAFTERLGDLLEVRLSELVSHVTSASRAFYC